MAGRPRAADDPEADQPDLLIVAGQIPHKHAFEEQYDDHNLRSN
ncbi:hypothetical protein ACFL33_04790 [Pseudomonadota bacterium]